MTNSVQKQIQGGVDGTVKETPKENSPVFTKCVYTLVGNNDQSLDVSAQKAKELGYNPVVSTVAWKARRRRWLRS